MPRGTRDGADVKMSRAYLLLRREVVDDVEELPDLLRRLALDHVCNRLAANVAVANTLSTKR